MRTINRIFSLALLLAFSLWPVANAAAQGDAPQIRITQVDNSKFPTVTVYVSVTNSAGEPIGVDPNTIEISENGQPMQAVDVRGGGEGKGEPVTTMLVIDISGSMDKDDKIGAAKAAAKTYVSQMRPGDQAGLIAFDTQVHVVQPVTSDIGALTGAIDGLQTGSDTAMYNAIQEAAKALEGVSGRKAIIVLSDGLDNQSNIHEDDIVNAVGPSGLTISAIGFGDPGSTGQAGIDEAGLRSLTSRSGGQYAYASDAQALSALYQQFGQALQSEYAITYISPATLRDGVNRNLTVSIAQSGAAAQGQYNPGGVLPEVTGRSWLLFGGIFVGILLLLLVPLLLGGGASLLGRFGGGGGGKKGKIKFAKPADSKSKGRIKLSRN
ncbi:MAG TPA: VWA domain-containing protein [Anaerolineales bacterium]